MGLIPPFGRLWDVFLGIYFGLMLPEYDAIDLINSYVYDIDRRNQINYVNFTSAYFLGIFYGIYIDLTPPWRFWDTV